MCFRQKKKNLGSINILSAQSVGSGPFTLSTPSGATNVQWFKDGTAISSATSTTYSATNVGVYWASYDDPAETCQVTGGAIHIVRELDATTSTTFDGPSSHSDYVWMKDGANIGGATNEDLVITNEATEVGTYALTYNNGNCTVNSELMKLFLLEAACAAGNTAPALTMPANQ